MAEKNYILVENESIESSDLSTFVFSEKQQGSGYNKRTGGLHTAQFELDQFKGSIKLQGTLDLYPGDLSWSDISYTSGSDLTALDSTALTTNETRNFLGNWVWIRAGYVLEQGTIVKIRYTF
jgi:hypothetical protein